MHVRRQHAGCVLQGALDGVGTRRAVHALHQQHRFGHLTLGRGHTFGKGLLLDGIVENGEVIGDRERTAVLAQPGRDNRKGGRSISGHGRRRARGRGRRHALRVIH